MNSSLLLHLDGDFITIADESDLSFAVQSNKVLQIKLFGECNKALVFDG